MDPDFDLRAIPRVFWKSCATSWRISGLPDLDRWLLSWWKTKEPEPRANLRAKPKRCSHAHQFRRGNRVLFIYRPIYRSETAPRANIGCYLFLFFWRFWRMFSRGRSVRAAVVEGTIDRFFFESFQTDSMFLEIGSRRVPTTAAASKMTEISSSPRPSTATIVSFFSSFSLIGGFRFLCLLSIVAFRLLHSFVSAFLFLASRSHFCLPLAFHRSN